MPMDVQAKLAILADAAKYDASCASSGAQKKNSSDGQGVGSTGGVGICHSYAPDGRCISLLKILLTNRCIYDCHYCINRRSSNVQRASFTAQEVVDLTLNFYKRNYIEGLFLSSGIVKDADYTMGQIVEVARMLREDHDFRGYLHLKTIPEASPDLTALAAKYADRISINIELPTQKGLETLAPEKNLGRTTEAMGRIRTLVDDAKDQIRDGNKKLRHATGQSTQVIVGADESSDADFLNRSSLLYNDYKLRRVYYSAFSPIPSPSQVLPLAPPPLVREHRLYQADWLMRYYGFEVGEIVSDTRPNLDLHLDPKTSWALRNRQDFPVSLQDAPREVLLRIPGVGVKTVDRILETRKHHKIRLLDLAKWRISLDKVRPFVITADYSPPSVLLDSDRWVEKLTPPWKQLELF